MAKTNETGDLSPIAQKTIEDSSGLIDRIANYVLINLNNDALVKSSRAMDPVEQEIRTIQGIISVINDLGAKILYNYLDEIRNEPESFPNTDKFIDEVNKAIKPRTTIITDPADAEKIKLNLAKNEASIKGFDLPLSIGGPSDELDTFNLDVQEQKKAMAATKQALLDLAGTDIPRSEYAKTVVESATKILAAGKDVKPESLENFKNYTKQGTREAKLKVAENELLVVKDVVSRSTEELLNFIKNPNQELISQSINKTLKTRFLSVPKGMNEDQKKLYSDKLDTIQELWGLNKDNYSGPAKIRYISNPSPHLDSSADAVFNKTLAELIPISSHEQLDKVAVKNCKDNPQLSKLIAETRDKNTSKAIVDEVVKNIIEKNKHTIDQDTKDRIVKQFTKDLEMNGEEYLRTNRDLIVKDLTKGLMKEKPLTSFFSKNFAISPKGLDKVTNKVMKYHHQPNTANGNKHIDSILMKTTITETQLQSSLKKFAENHNISSYYSKNLSDIRKINPPVFDSMVLGIKPTVEVKESLSQAQTAQKVEVKTKLTPPPSLYTPPLNEQISKPLNTPVIKASIPVPSNPIKDPVIKANLMNRTTKENIPVEAKVNTSIAGNVKKPLPQPTIRPGRKLPPLPPTPPTKGISNHGLDSVISKGSIPQVSQNMFKVADANKQLNQPAIIARKQPPKLPPRPLVNNNTKAGVVTKTTINAQGTLSSMAKEDLATANNINKQMHQPPKNQSVNNERKLPTLPNRPSRNNGKGGGIT